MITPLEGYIIAFIILTVFFVYPYLAIVRIWFYSKQQTRILKDIRDSLVKIELSVGK